MSFDFLFRACINTELTNNPVDFVPFGACGLSLLGYIIIALIILGFLFTFSSKFRNFFLNMLNGDTGFYGC